ncbi:DUF3892 domain-containing protein [Hathewaya massiliensis]|uniref:DUF3892 domain-containing protein n=1 Tax=Hathewaya massiliensis TaxID=1964382 RepID=UPI00163C2D20|nr:DUF3892 domain-containing protein [Hathewaya massiliensis]
MADYYIYSVHQENDIIKTVKTCTFYISTILTNKKEKTREEVVYDIDQGNKTIYTIYKNSSGKYELGAKVITETIEGKKYIKTKANGKKCDNLDNIEQY